MSAEIDALLMQLWAPLPDRRLDEILPRSLALLDTFYGNLQKSIDRAPEMRKGYVDPAAIVRGRIVSMGEGSVIEAGAIIHASCRLVLGERSVIRSGAVLRDEVVVGSDSLVGVHCEIARCLITGPNTFLGHRVLALDTVVGADTNIAGGCSFANTKLDPAAPISIRLGKRKFPTTRTHLGALIGDRVKIGASTDLSPGTVVLPDVVVPPRAVLLGTIDSARAQALFEKFFTLWSPDP